MSARELITEHLDLWTGAVTQKATRGRGSNGKVELTGIKRLRELILELAIHGKLVEQYPADTPADQLLAGIAERRKDLISEKKIKNSKPLPPVAIDEFPSKLPAGWTWTRLGTIAEVNPRNAGDDGLEASFIPMPLVTTSYNGEHGDEPRNWGEIKKGYSHFANGDLGLAKITPCFENSKAAVFRNLRNGIGAGTTELHVARPLSSTINPHFLLLFVKSPRFLTEGEKVMTGSAGQKRVPKDYFSGTPLPLPPAEEQHRIVKKVDELMALCDRLEQQTSDQLEAHETLVDTLLGTLTQSENAIELADNWARLAAHFDTLFTTEQSIDKLKQTILQLAVMGRLVEQCPNETSAHQLLDRIAERRKELISTKKIKNSKPLPPVTSDETPSKLPTNWVWTRLGTIAEINPRNIGGDGLTASFIPMSLVTTAYHGEHGDEPRNWGAIRKGYSHFANGDVGLAKITPCFENSKAAIFRNLRNGIGAGTTELHVARPLSSVINPHYLLLFLKSPRFLTEGKKVMTGSAGQKRVPKNYFSETPLPLPPEEEQHRIVQKVDELMALCDQLKQRLNQASETRCQLAESVVAQAIS